MMYFVGRDEVEVGSSKLQVLTRTERRSLTFIGLLVKEFRSYKS